VGIEFFASAWDLEAVRFLWSDAMRCRFVKVGSADITYLPLLREIAARRWRVFLSTGAATMPEVKRAMEVLGSRTAVPMACTLSYPAEALNLARIRVLQYEFPGEVGYSDHSLSTHTGRQATIAGADWLEKHFTITPGVGGDHDFALTPGLMTTYVEQARAGELDRGADWLEVTSEEKDARLLARRSLHATAPIAVGEQLRPGENCDWLRPALPGGIEPF
jgi:sialic acid synthase SpsE